MGALRNLRVMGCREGSRGTDFPIRDPGWMAQNGTEPAGLMPSHPDEGVWAYVWPPRRGQFHAIKPKTGLMGTPASGPACLD